MIDVKTTDPTQPRQKRPTRVLVAGILTAAAALAAVAFVVIRDADEVTPAHEPSTTVTVSTTTPPRALPDTQGELEAGTYFVDEVDGMPTPRIFVTLGDGWGRGSEGLTIGKADIGYMGFSRPERVFLDACHPSHGFYTVTTVDRLVAELREQKGWAEVTAPADISVDGYAGKAFQRTAPAVMADCSTRFGGTRLSDGRVTFADFRSWEGIGGPGVYEPGQIETLWVLDVDGTIVVISTGLWPETSATAHADFADAELDSIRIDPG